MERIPCPGQSGLIVIAFNTNHLDACNASAVSKQIRPALLRSIEAMQGALQ